MCECKCCCCKENIKIELGKVYENRKGDLYFIGVNDEHEEGDDEGPFPFRGMKIINGGSGSASFSSVTLFTKEGAYYSIRDNPLDLIKERADIKVTINITGI